MWIVSTYFVAGSVPCNHDLWTFSLVALGTRILHYSYLHQVGLHLLRWSEVWSPLPSASPSLGSWRTHVVWPFQLWFSCQASYSKVDWGGLYLLWRCILESIALQTWYYCRAPWCFPCSKEGNQLGIHIKQPQSNRYRQLYWLLYYWASQEPNKLDYHRKI